MMFPPQITEPSIRFLLGSTRVRATTFLAPLGCCWSVAVPSAVSLATLVLASWCSRGAGAFTSFRLPVALGRLVHVEEEAEVVDPERAWEPGLGATI